MADLPILAAGQSREVPLNGVVYTIRALTYGEMSALQLRQAARVRPHEMEVTEATAEACRALNREDLAGALFEHDEVNDELSALYTGRPPATDAEGGLRWDAEKEPEIVALRRRLLKLKRLCDFARQITAGSESVMALRDRMMGAIHADNRETVAAGLVSIGAHAGPWTPDQVEGVHAGVLLALASEIQAMQSVTRDAAKN